MMRLVGTLLGLAALAGAAAHSANAQALACGAEVTSDVKLEASLTGCATGLVVTADDITIDLNGHTIEGVGAAGSIGIEAANRSGVTVRDGRIRGFETGVQFRVANQSTVDHVRITDSSVGIELLASVDSRVLANSVVDNVGSGIVCDRSGGTEIEKNHVSRNGVGIDVSFCPETDIVDNDVTANRSSGIVRTRSNGRVEHNRANQNEMWGILSDDSHGEFVKNTTNRNGQDGLFILDVLPDHGPAHTVTGHVANGNGRFGIFTELVGVVDGGKNRAHANGAPAQCSGILCNARGN
jgi:parallel beta-helix repeat protein